MNDKSKLYINLYKKLSISEKSKVYHSNIGIIIVSDKGDYVYKIYNDKKFYEKEIFLYNLLSNKSINIPNFEGLGLIEKYFILKLENIRKEYGRKNYLKDLDLNNIANILNIIHNIKCNGKNLILGDIHSSNFYEYMENGEKKLGIFDFSSWKYGDIEEDLANIYIDLNLNLNLFNKFKSKYSLKINTEKLYSYTIIELYERIKNGMNLEINKKKMYYKFLLKINNLLGK